MHLKINQAKMRAPKIPRILLALSHTDQTRNELGENAKKKKKNAHQSLFRIIIDTCIRNNLQDHEANERRCNFIIIWILLGMCGYIR